MLEMLYVGWEKRMEDACGRSAQSCTFEPMVSSGLCRSCRSAVAVVMIWRESGGEESKAEVSVLCTIICAQNTNGRGKAGA
jgi:hypothetical protein